jgi:hypothetical protein
MGSKDADNAIKGGTDCQSGLIGFTNPKSGSPSQPVYDLKIFSGIKETPSRMM